MSDMARSQLRILSQRATLSSVARRHQSQMEGFIEGERLRLQIAETKRQGRTVAVGQLICENPGQCPCVGKRYNKCSLLGVIAHPDIVVDVFPNRQYKICERHESYLDENDNYAYMNGFINRCVNDYINDPSASDEHVAEADMGVRVQAPPVQQALRDVKPQSPNSSDELNKILEGVRMQ